MRNVSVDVSVIPMFCVISTLCIATNARNKATIMIILLPINYTNVVQRRGEEGRDRFILIKRGLRAHQYLFSNNSRKCHQILRVPME